MSGKIDLKKNFLLVIEFHNNTKENVLLVIEFHNNTNINSTERCNYHKCICL